jgi:hypothetical protein
MACKGTRARCQVLETMMRKSAPGRSRLRDLVARWIPPSLHDVIQDSTACAEFLFRTGLVGIKYNESLPCKDVVFDDFAVATLMSTDAAHASDSLNILHDA